MRIDAGAVVVWGLALAGLAAGLWAAGSGWLPIAVFFGAAAAAIVIGLSAAARRPRDRPRALPQTSHATVLLAVGAALAAVGLVVGPWLSLPGGGLAALGAAGLLRELRAQGWWRRP